MFDDDGHACCFERVMLVWTAASMTGLVPATSFVLDYLLACLVVNVSKNIRPGKPYKLGGHETRRRDARRYV